MLSKFTTSLTKYSAGLVSSTMNNQLSSYLGPTRILSGVDDSVLAKYLNVDDLSNSSLPSFWSNIAGFPSKVVGLFSAVAIATMHKDYIEAFKKASEVGKGRGVMKNTYFTGDRKPFTNLRRYLVDSGAAHVNVERADDVPYDFTPLLQDGNAGKIVKELLIARLTKIGWKDASNTPNAEFVHDFYEQSFYYGLNKVIGLTQDQYRQWLEGNSLSFDTIDLTTKLTKQVEIDGNLLLSLAAKQFIILSGPSGTGKTLGIRKLAASLNLNSTDPNFNITFIPVEAGWKDGRPILGHKNPFGEDGEVYQSTKLLEALIKANYYREIPFFVVFDEMNLSHVEMYFAKFLSLIETSNHAGLKSEPILNIEELQLLSKGIKQDYDLTNLINAAINKGGLFISSNIFFIGTVNIDETTYMFSPKVLDRAFVIELDTHPPDQFKITHGIASQDKVTISIKDANAFLIDSVPIDLTIQKGLIQHLKAVYDILDGFTFGDRVTKEALTYDAKATIIASQLSWAGTSNVIQDKVLLQKILPKLHGNRKQLSTVLSDLKDYCDSNGLQDSSKKLLRMSNQLEKMGYSSFIV